MKQVACRKIGLDCNYVIKGETEEEPVKTVVNHAWERHAIKPEEMNSEMNAKIKENIHSL
jgi:predicted small metal-binding protein